MFNIIAQHEPPAPNLIPRRVRFAPNFTGWYKYETLSGLVLTEVLRLNLTLLFQPFKLLVRLYEIAPETPCPA